jgi:hypothetical protein
MLEQDNWWAQDKQVDPAASGRAAPPAFIPGPPKQIDPAEQARLGMAQQDQERQNTLAPYQIMSAKANVTNAESQQYNTRNSHADKLRDDYNQDASVKAFTRALPPYMASLKGDASPAADLALTYAFATMMDPNSAVREGEQQMQSTGDTIYGQTVAKLRKEMGSGGSFRPEYRAQLLRQMRGRGAELRQVYDSVRRDFEGRAQRTGINPADVLPADPAAQFGNAELEFWAKNGDKGAAAELQQRNGDQSPEARPVSLDRGTFAFNDQVPEEVKGYRLSPDQESEIAKAVQDGDEGQAVSLVEKASGYPATAETRQSIRNAIKNKGRISFDYGTIDDARKAQLHGLIEKADSLSANGKPSDLGMLAAEGGSAGFGDEVSGVAGGAGSFLMGRGYSKGYNDSRDAQLLRLEEARKRQGWAGTAAEIGGGIATPVGALGRVAEGGNLLARVAQGARAGAVGGALAGAGYSEGQNRLLGAGLGGAGGAIMGSALPVGGQVLENRVGGLRRLLGRDPELPRRLVGESIAADGNTPRSVGNALMGASGRGSPMAIADTGDNARQLLASVGRQPGPSRTLTRESVVERQLAQQERIAGAVVRDLGPTANIRETGDALIEQARTAAAPHYERFYSGTDARSGASSVKLTDLMSRPSMRKGLANARRIAAEEGRDPDQLGLILDRDGALVLNPEPASERAAASGARDRLSLAQEAYRSAKANNGDVEGARKAVLSARDELRTSQDALKAAPAPGEPTEARSLSWQTMDYMKRGMDDYIESFRDPVTGVLNLNTEGRAANQTLRQFISRVDNVNPAYRAARDAYAGPARLQEALQRGSKALSRAPDDLSAEIARMSEPEREMYRLGLRKSITDFLESKTDGSDKVQALIGTPKKRAALARAFGGRAEYDRFIATLGDEAAMGQTYRAVAGNSATAERQAFDQTTNDTGLAETAMDAALRGGKDGMWSATVAAVQKLRDVGRFGAGEAGQRTRESIAALLTETDPAALRELVRAAHRAQALQRVKSRAGTNPRRAIASGVGDQIGGALGTRLASERSKQ